MFLSMGANAWSSALPHLPIQDDVLKGIEAGVGVGGHPQHHKMVLAVTCITFTGLAAGLVRVPCSGGMEAA